MINKSVTAAFWDRDLEASHLIDVSSKGLEKSQLDKYAASSIFKNAEIHPEDGYAFVHVITNASMDHYGPNSNNDGFNEAACEWEFPCKCGHQKTAMLGGGLKEYHSTYMQYGGAYRNHKNSKKTDPSTGKPFEKLGSIAAEAYNEDMHRGELILKLPVNKWGDVLEKVANSEPVCWSMGTAVPTDCCSRCCNRAKKRSDYCEHLRYDMGKIAEDGSRTFAINDVTFYHDISEVGMNPAMKVAYTLEKVAAFGMIPQKDEIVREGLWLPLDLVKKLSSERERSRIEVLQKLAAKEKETPTESDKNLSEAFEHSDEEQTDIADKLKGVPLDQVISQSKQHKVLLPPKSFSIIVIRSGKPADDQTPNWLEGVPEKLKSIFGDILQDPNDTEEVASDGHYSPSCHFPDVKTSHKVKDLVQDLSVDPEPVKQRAIKASVKGKEKMDKKASSLSEVEDQMARVMAKEYAKYQLAFLSDIRTPSDCLSMVIAQNRAG